MGEEPVEPPAPSTLLVHIGERECRELLAGCTLGRIGVVVEGRPEIFPVSYAYDAERGSVMFPTNPRTKLRAALNWPWVAFEIDGLADDGTSGWSVLMVGTAEEITDPREIDTATAKRVVHWRTGAETRWLRIIPSTVSGRRISSTRDDP
jgi:nitroimidazol reductase NimA-like FMN-containing flavoprotein (pyridoxamine 5'-phosphate oxidase superfamily)